VTETPAFVPATHDGRRQPYVDDEGVHVARAQQQAALNGSTRGLLTEEISRSLAPGGRRGGSLTEPPEIAWASDDHGLSGTFPSSRSVINPMQVF